MRAAETERRHTDEVGTDESCWLQLTSGGTARARACIAEAAPGQIQGDTGCAICHSLLALFYHCSRGLSGILFVLMETGSALLWSSWCSTPRAGLPNLGRLLHE